VGGFDLRVAIVSDIHGNLTALDAVVADLERREPDAVVHGGDLALSGARPAEVVDRVRELGWPGVVGNTDELLWRPEDRAAQEARAPKLRDLLRILFESHRPATDELLGQQRLEWLRELPRQWRLGALALVHASPGDLWRAPMPDASEEELARVYGELGADVVAYGHIHRPYVRKLGELTVANSGSVGMPGDGDWRASYLLLDEGVPSVRRVEYDLERELAVLERSGYPHADWIAERLRSGRFVRPPGRLP
jgi:putative phosphoesterase